LIAINEPDPLADPKAFPMAHLAQLVAMLPGWVRLVLTTTEFDIAPVPKR
jgi:hypothetical protein